MTLTSAPAPSVNEAPLSRLRRIRLVPVIVIDDPDNAVPLARALEAGGLPCAEITFRTPCAAEALRRIRDECPDVLAGAGTVLTPAQAAEARRAGAQFVVTPGFGPAVVDYCREHDMAVFPGIATPTELEAALAKGLSVVKFFPAETLGGIAYLKAMSAPYCSDVEFMPSGGISISNIGEYLSFSRVVSCGGSWIAPPDLIAARQFDRIRNEAAQAVAAVSRISGAPAA
jgi:2-dehydro-3-deoxyphosphogluconate aldolase / (4S)-4-hydroxy-2-oxoglutarate aldolase